jgi:steroid 5-alpha reductase family enzyme
MNPTLTMLIGPLCLIHFFYLLAVVKKNLSVIDTAWGLGFILISLTGSSLSHFNILKENILTCLIVIWGLRLALFIHYRNVGKGEDFRYASWRKDWGQRTNLIAYFKVYWLQFFLMILTALPLIGVHQSVDNKLSPLNIMGIVIWIIGFFWETIADQQKSQFKKIAGNEHKVCQKGLWSFSRHPNYFGEAFLWWGIGLAGFEGSYWWALIGPLFISFLLWKVSGVPLVEARHAHNPEYQIYASHTPVMIPSVKKMMKVLLRESK